MMEQLTAFPGDNSCKNVSSGNGIRVDMKGAF